MLKTQTMRKQFFIFLVLFTLNYSFTKAANTKGSAQLPTGTNVYFEVFEPINAKNYDQGDTVNCRVKHDVKANESIVVTAGTPVLCRIKTKHSNGICGRPGEIQLEPISTTAVDGQIINLTGDLPLTTGNSKKKLSMWLGWGGCLFTSGISLVALLIKGDHAVIASGTSYQATTNNSYTITINGTTTTSSTTASKTNDNQMRGGSDPFKGTNVANVNKDIKVGKYYALIIGIDNYSGTWAPLKNAVNDAKAIESLLKLEYKIDVFKTLYNAQATRANILNEMEWLVNNVKENDNVLIYYSGHGEYKKELNKGFWVPADANANAMSQFVSNNDIQTFLSGINSKHTLLISDACFSGDIFRGNTSSIPFENSEKYYFNVYNAKSRQAISSGGIEPVMDGGKNGHSVFAYYLLQALQTNEAKYYDAGQLYNKIKIPVVNNSEQQPNFNPIKNSGDEGGQFLFIKK